MNRRTGVFLLALLAACLLFALPAAAEDAPELTAQCVFTSNANSKEFSLMTDGNYTTRYALKEKKGERWQFAYGLRITNEKTILQRLKSLC